MKHQLLDIVFAAVDVPGHGVKAGDLGTVVEVFGDAYEIEFSNDLGETVAMFPMSEHEVRATEPQRQAA